MRAEVEGTLRALREMARCAPTKTLDDSRRWIEVIAVADMIDAAERDPLDLERGLENLVRVAAQYDDEEADARAARFAMSLGATFQEARRILLGHGRMRQRAAAINALEGGARAFALRLWGPLLATRPTGEADEEPDLAATWELLASTPAELLDIVKERRQVEIGIGSQILVDLGVKEVALRRRLSVRERPPAPGSGLRNPTAPCAGRR